MQQQQQPPAPPNTTVAAAAAEVAAALPKQASAKKAAAGAGPQPGKCQFFLATKRRYCKFDATPGQQFCGNHVLEGTGVGPKRVMCPYGNHSVLESELKKHKAKCPTYRYWQAKQQQPCYLEDCNAGKGGDVQWPPGLQPLPPQLPAAAAATASAEGGKEQQASAKQQRPPPKAAAFAASMGKQQFMQLLHRIQTACDQVSSRMVPPARCLPVVPAATERPPARGLSQQQQAEQSRLSIA
jgi:tRNA:m4X modification enzyme